MSDRLGSIGKILDSAPARRRLGELEPRTPASTPVTAVPDLPAPEATKPQKTEKAAKAPRRPNATTATKARIPVRLPDQLNRRLSTAAHDQRKTLLEVLFDALEAAAGNPVPVERRITDAQRPAVTQGALFTRTEKRVAAPKVQVEFGLTASNAQALDLMVTQLKASNRSELIVAALDEYLD
ncbi:hypothetical protein ACLM5J_19835 [Nocardioides sp. Bht2]|uniref:hypothetical protein n=1 Tax=Nocardioides sp. Bht2 TaxID=3392297 RepID=UPI0039B427DB